MLAAALIVRDEAEHIGDCLRGIRPHVDGIFVYDTGSIDNTPELAEQAGAVVKRGEWRDDFAWARNQSFAMPPPEFTWLTWLDADDRIEDAEWLRKLSLGNDAAPIDAFVCDYHYGGRGREVTQAVRIVRRSAGYRWCWPVHEQLMAPVPDRARMVAMIKPIWIHTAMSADKRRTSAERNLRIIAQHADTAHEFLTREQLRIFRDTERNASGVT